MLSTDHAPVMRAYNREPHCLDKLPFMSAEADSRFVIPLLLVR